MPHICFCPHCNAPHEIVVDVKLDCIACKQTFIAIMPTLTLERLKTSRNLMHKKPLLVAIRRRIKGLPTTTVQITNWLNYTEKGY